MAWSLAASPAALITVPSEAGTPSALAPAGPAAAAIARLAWIPIILLTAVFLVVAALALLPAVRARRARRADRIVKRRKYQLAGVAEYWIINLDARLVERWRPGDERPGKRPR